MNAKLADADARARIADDLDATFIVEAAAGTGKTTQLVQRMVKVLDSGRTTLDRMVAVTFTEKAAGEMKLRLRAELERARLSAADGAVRARLEQALESLEVAHINTIHGFCADLLRERPLEAGVDPSFEVLDDPARERLLERAFTGFFEQVLDAPGEGVRRILRRQSAREPRTGPRGQLLDACRNLVEQRDFGAPWSTPAYDRTAMIDALVTRLGELSALAERAGGSRDRLAQALRAFRDLHATIALAERTRQERDYDGIEAQLVELGRERLFTWEGGSGRLLAEGLERSYVLERRTDLRGQLDTFLQLAEADLAAKLQRELAPVVRAYEEHKRKAGALDFVDLLLCTRDLLRDHAQVRGELQRRFTHLFVDEFQDTDPLQAEILLLLAAASDESDAPLRGKLFLVGDPKQSIYRFRRADVALYERVKQQLIAHGAELLHLTTSFRARPELQSAINAAFEPLMQEDEDGGQASYVPLSPYRGGLPEQPALIALPIPEPYGRSGATTKTAIEGSYPDAAAAFVAWLVTQSGFQVEEDGRMVPVKARHVCLLFRRFQAWPDTDLTRGYVRGLEARGIPHVLVGGRSLHGREEVIALRAALCAIEWPDDELDVYATLRGPLFAISDEELLVYRNRPEYGHLRPLRQHTVSEREAHPAVCDALALLGALHRGRNRCPIGDTIVRLLEATRAHAAVAIWPTGEQALANLLALVDAAHAFESRNALSFRGFVEWLEDQAERGQGSEASIVEEGTEGVRLMTVHKAKGLEFPVVVLCDPTAQVAPNSATRFSDSTRGLWAQRLCGCRPQELIENEALVIAKEAAENVRLAYVAATRARDLLVVPVFGDAREGKVPGIGWVDALAPAVYPTDANRRAAGAVPGCPAFGDDSVRMRPQQAAAEPGSGIMPGMHRGFADANSVVWWDPDALALGARPIGGVRQQHLLTATERSSAFLRAHDDWAAQRAVTLERAGEPTRVARPVTTLAATRDTAAFPIPVESTDVARAGRPGGARFGILVHAVLAKVDLAAEQSAIEALCALEQRVHGASDEERAAAALAVSATLRHPLMRRAAGALECHREAPLYHRLEDGSIALGVADLAFREPAGWVVVDFKTDAELRAEGRYSEQLRLYMEAIEAATGVSATGLLLSV